MLRTLSSRQPTRHAVLIAALIIVAATSACTSATPTPAPTAAVIATAAPTATDVPTALPTATEVPTALPTETPTTAATATETAAPTLGPAAENSLSAWCLPEGVSTVYIESPLTPYLNSRIGAIRDGALELHNLPVAACTFIYQFNQPAPEGLTLAVYEQDAAQPWLTTPLQALEGQPQTVSATLTHTYIIAFPFWQVGYRFAVLDSSGAELRSDQVNLFRWTPELCWNGALPNLNTLRCPLQQDLHPWDAGYGTPMPTAKPKE